MRLHRRIRNGAVWVEILLALAVLVLIFQFFPHLPERIVEIADFRRWSGRSWLSINLIILGLLACLRGGPSLIDAARRWQKENRERATAPKGPMPQIKKEDVRALMRRDERIRRETLQRRMLYYTAVLPLVIGVFAAGLAWAYSAQESAVRSRNMLLVEGAGLGWDDSLSGVVGVEFSIRPDRPVKVSHLGFFDSNKDGLQLDHKVGLFAVHNRARKPSLVAEVIVPFGKTAPLEGQHRWVALDNPVELKPGADYILAAESHGAAGDSWPQVFDKEFLEQQELPYAWNPNIVSSETSPRELSSSKFEWPAFPNNGLNTPDGITYGPANLIAQAQ